MEKKNKTLRIPLVNLIVTMKPQFKEKIKGQMISLFSKKTKNKYIAIKTISHDQNSSLR